MSELPEENQELSKGNQELDQDVDLSRRKLAKIGAAAPVIMTLASKPVFGAQCLSQMMSGNASHHEGSCSLGWSPGGWGGEGGQINGMATAEAWQAAGFVMGAVTCTQNNSGKTFDYFKSGNNFTCVFAAFPDPDAGSLVSAVFPGHYHADKAMLEVVCDPTIDNDLRHCLAAYLNASLSESLSVTGFNYVLTTGDVLGFCNNPSTVPWGMSLVEFLDTTWETPSHFDP